MDCGRGTTSLPAQMARKRQRQRGSGVEGSDDSDVELGGQTVPDDPTLLQFDLGLRPHRISGLSRQRSALHAFGLAPSTPSSGGMAAASRRTILSNACD